VVGAREAIVVTLDWTEFGTDDHAESGDQARSDHTGGLEDGAPSKGGATPTKTICPAVSARARGVAGGGDGRPGIRRPQALKAAAGDALGRRTAAPGQVLRADRGARGVPVGVRDYLSGR